MSGVADPLTVLLVAPAGSVHTRRWAATLARAGHRVVIASLNRAAPPPAAELRVAPAGLFRPLAWAWLRRLVRQVRPDVVHVHSLGAHGLLALALPAGAPRVLTPWGSELRAARRSAARAAVVRLATARADLVLPTSAEVAAELTGRYAVPAARVRVLSWGVAEELISASALALVRPQPIRAAFGIPADATVVLSVRTASATYRVREVVTAFAEAGRADQFLVVLAGHLPSSAAARRAARGYLDELRALCVPGRMLVIDRVLSPGEAFGLMCACDVAVSVPAADQRSSSVLEAALAGCRLLLSDIAPYRELVRDGLAADLLAEPVGRSLAGALRRVRPDPAGRAVNRAFILAREHGAEKAAALGQVYRELRNGPGAAGVFRSGCR